MSSEADIYPLQGAVQHYDWGGKEYIPKLLSKGNPEQKPFAEYWIGTHHRGPAQVKIKNSWVDIREISNLPFLLKILDVDDMLSIQSHPNKQQAEIGFAHENKIGIPLDAKHRVFKDDNHKPELMVALSDFWLLHGFRSSADIHELLDSIPPFHPLKKEFTDLRTFYSHLMNMPAEQCDGMLSSLKEYLKTIDCSDKNQAHYWATRAFAKYGLDKGIFSIYFFNVVKLSTGEAIYQEAGVPHAYLEGQNVEIMANSDNVFRAGLTPKHIDIDLLIDHLVFESITPHIIHPQASGNYEDVFLSPATEFEVRQISLLEQDVASCKSQSPECYFVLDGSVKIETGSSSQVFDKGQSFYVEENIHFNIIGLSQSRLIRALTPAVQ